MVQATQRRVPGLGRVLWATACAFLAADGIAGLLLRGDAARARRTIETLTAGYGAPAVADPGLALLRLASAAWETRAALFIAAAGAVWLACRATGPGPLGTRGRASVVWGLPGGILGAAATIFLASPGAHHAMVLAAWCDGLLRGSLSAISALVIVVLAVSVASEFAFRGTILPALEKAAGFGAATAATSVLFAALWPLASGLAAGAALGVITAWLYRRTGGLLAPLMANVIASAGYVAVAFYLAPRFIRPG